MPENLQADLDSVPLKLINQVNTRWNGTYYMMQRIRDIFVSVILMTLSKIEIAPPLLGNHEFNWLE